MKKKYRKLARVWHPDKNLCRQKQAADVFAKISRAYTVLMDPKLKEIYDSVGLAGLLRFEDGDTGGIQKRMSSQKANPGWNLIDDGITDFVAWIEGR
jgi:DnaJ-class molecular chaperone